MARGELPEDGVPQLRVFEAQWRAGSRLLAHAWNVPAGVGNFDAYTGMIPARLLRAQEALGRRGIARAAGLWGFSFAVTPANPGALPLIALAPPFDIAGEDPELRAWLVRIPHRPRAYVARDVMPGDADAALEFSRGEPPDSSRTIVEGPVPPVHGGGGDARVTRDEPERVVVHVDVSGEAPALLVLSDQYAPGWSVDVDGAPAEIVRANDLVRGVWVAPGRHAVTFRYRTPGLLAGVAIALCIGCVLATWALLLARRPRAGASSSLLPLRLR
ncbi:MAG TPA: YfhO family protein [Anaeromyxobacter sp.]|nr:YfhO family protein [Anaeromyxobacter sp.]